MQTHEQQGLLNEFVGVGDEPSIGLVERAEGVLAALDQAQANPLVVYNAGANSRDHGLLHETDSKMVQAAVLTRMVGRNALTLMAAAPHLARIELNAYRFKRRLQHEYPGVFDDPVPGDAFFAQKPLKKDPTYYARQLESYVDAQEAA